jgi:hypothetical protein
MIKIALERNETKNVEKNRNLFTVYIGINDMLLLFRIRKLENTGFSLDSNNVCSKLWKMDQFTQQRSLS